MLLAIDIGNTNLSIGIYEDKNLVYTSRLATDVRRTADQYALELQYACYLKGIDITGVSDAIISSVVPELTNVVSSAVLMLINNAPMVLGPGVKSGLNIRIDNPAQLGADFVATSVGAIDKYALPCLVLDLGTATKISVIDGKGAFRGCTIAPGVNISLGALAEKASLLSSINLQVAECPSYGTNTVSSMQAGIILGTACMLDGLCDSIEESLGEKIQTFVATGGLSENIIRFCKHNVTYDADLLLDGLRVIAEKNK